MKLTIERANNYLNSNISQFLLIVKIQSTLCNQHFSYIFQNQLSAKIIGVKMKIAVCFHVLHISYVLGIMQIVKLMLNHYFQGRGGL